jgi:hypothetical protein
MSYVGSEPAAFLSGKLVTIVQGTITNTGTAPATFTVEVSGGGGVSGSGTAANVLVGQTAIWSVRLPEQVPVGALQVRAEPGPAAPGTSTAAITRQRQSMFPDFGEGTELMGTLTNTGRTAGVFAVELVANTGQVSRGTDVSVAPGATDIWAALFSGTVFAHIVRVTTAVPPPP